MSAMGWLGRTTLLVLAMTTPVWAQQGLRWETDVETAQRLAAESNRLVLLHFGAVWCPPCQRLEKNVFSQAGFGKELDAKYVAVRLDFDKHHALANKYGVTQIPADVITTPNGKLLQKQNSPSSGSRYIEGLQLVAAKHAPALPAKAETAVAAATPPAQAAPVQTPPSVGPYAPPEAVAAMKPTQVPVTTTPASVAVKKEIPQLPPPVSVPAAVAAAPVTHPATPPAATPAPVAAPPVATVAANPNPATPPAATPAAQPITLPPGSPPLALDGYCPVTLVEKTVWTVGDVRWGAIHRGRTYLFTSQALQQQFLANPDHFSPVMSGNDPVMALDDRQEVQGKREFGVFVDGRIYLFANETTLDKFMKNSNRYAAEVTQAMKP